MRFREMYLIFLQESTIQSERGRDFMAASISSVKPLPFLTLSMVVESHLRVGAEMIRAFQMSSRVHMTCESFATILYKRLSVIKPIRPCHGKVRFAYQFLHIRRKRIQKHLADERRAESRLCQGSTPRILYPSVSRESFAGRDSDIVFRVV
jgi:hypothetical protein